MTELVFRIGEETLPSVMTRKEWVKSPFKDTVKTGLSHVERLMSVPVPEGAPCDTYQYPNNIVAFLGERGSGKTSVLLTVREYLRSQSAKQKEDGLAFLRVIDPSFFDNEHNILDIFIGELYLIFKQLCKGYYELDDIERQELRELQSKFREAKRAIYFLTGRKQQEPVDEMDELGRLSDGVELRDIVADLVRIYLKFCGKSCLVVSIDDLDLNATLSYEMMEQLRKYLAVPRVVILLAAKLSQLRQGVCNTLTGKFHNILGRTLNNEDIEDMAERYLEKFIPAAQRVYMPSSGNFLSSGLRIIDGDKETVFNSASRAGVWLIFSRTGYTFYSGRGVSSSLILPRNLRAFRDFVTTLYRLPVPVPGSGRENEDRRGNQTVFWRYFTAQWMLTLDSGYRNFANGVISEFEFDKLNKLVALELNANADTLSSWKNNTAHYSDGSFLSRGTLQRYEEIVNEGNNPANVSLGDVAFLLDLVRTFEDSEQSRRLLFFVSTLYSIRLTDIISHFSLYPQQHISYLFDFIINGSFMTLTGATAIPASAAGFSREMVEIDGDALNEGIRRITAIHFDKGALTEEETAMLRVLEFFILTSRRTLYDLKGVDYTPFRLDRWRADIDRERFAPLDRSKNILFDISASLVNLIYPEKAYGRFGDSIYNIALATKESLLNRLTVAAGVNSDDGNLSLKLIGADNPLWNMEMLETWQRRLKSESKGRAKGNDDVFNLATVFSRMAKLSVPVYDHGDPEATGNISFGVLGALAEELDEVVKNNALRQLFFSVYPPEAEQRLKGAPARKATGRKGAGKNAPARMRPDNEYTLEYIGKLIDSYPAQTPDKDKLNMAVSVLMEGRHRILADELAVSLRDIGIEVSGRILSHLFTRKIIRKYFS